MSSMRLNPEFNRNSLPLRQMFEAAIGNEGREVVPLGETLEIRRQNTVGIRRENRFIDDREIHEARSRSCLARFGIPQLLITLEFRSEEAQRLEPAWREILRSLRLGGYINDPRRGARYGYG